MPSVTDATLPIHSRTESSSHDDERGQRTRDLFAEAAACDDPGRVQQLHDEIVVLNLPVADALARRYAARGLDLDDLSQVARLALVRVVPQFRAEFGRDFLAYAVPSILGALRKQFRDSAWTVRPPRRVQEAQHALSKLRPDLVQRLGREPSVAEICAESGLEEDTVIEALNVDGCFTPASLDRPVGTSDDGQAAQFSDFLGAEDPQFVLCETRAALRPLLANLDSRDRKVLLLRFVEGLTQREVGEQIGVTQMQVSRILTRVLGTLRDGLGDLSGSPAA
ncbi:MAG: sigma-70 family RNA polymerase sigma factor [Marmoricola sp.]